MQLESMSEAPVPARLHAPAGTQAAGDGLLDPHGLGVHELLDPVGAQFPAITGALYAAEGKARVGSHQRVHKYLARLDLGGEMFRPLQVPREKCRPQPEVRVVRDPDRLRLRTAAPTGADLRYSTLLNSRHLQ